MKKLVKRLQRGEEEAYRELYASVQKKLLYFDYRITGSPDDTQEIVQETFERVFTKVGSLKNPDLLVSWIYRIASNLSKDRLKQNGRYSDEPLEETDVSSEEMTDEIVFKKMDQQNLEAALGRVHAKYREILILHYINGCSYQDIAIILDLRVAQIRGRIYQAKQSLRRELNEMETTTREKRVNENFC
jgi:RNA polymerase sigma-70 factor (ECF subfamily)